MMLVLMKLSNVCVRLANKQDVEGALDEGDICDRLNLETLANHYETPCRIVSTIYLVQFLYCSIFCFRFGGGPFAEY